MKPLRAATCEDEDLCKIRFPVMASPKLDGIRCLIKDNQALSKSLKLIPNNHVQHLTQQWWPNGFDGELIVGCATAPDVYHTTHSAVMSREGCPDVTFCVFDKWDTPEEAFSDRIRHTCTVSAPKMMHVPYAVINTLEELIVYQDECLKLGYEGIVIRDPAAGYKYGKSTVKQGIILKRKPFVDAEAIIVGIEEQMHNNNEATVDELGRSKRSTHKANMSPAGTMGKLLVKDIVTGIEFKIGIGFSAPLRDKMWNNKEAHIGLMVKYKSQKVGVMIKPRIPVFLGFRDSRDM